MKSFTRHMNEHESPEDLELRQVLEELVDLGLFEGFADSLLAEARGGFSKVTPRKRSSCSPSSSPQSLPLP